MFKTGNPHNRTRHITVSALQGLPLEHLNPKVFIITSFIEDNSKALLIIDLDAGLDKTGFFVFLTNRLRPQTPLVLVTARTLLAGEHSYIRI